MDSKHQHLVRNNPFNPIAYENFMLRIKHFDVLVMFHQGVLILLIALFFSRLVSSKFTKRPSNVSLEIGGSTWVHCRGKGYPEPKVIFIGSKKGGDHLDPDHFVVHKNGSMEIKNVREEDLGDYLCWLNNKFSSVYSTFYITLACKNFLVWIKKSNFNVKNSWRQLQTSPSSFVNIFWRKITTFLTVTFSY